MRTPADGDGRWNALVEAERRFLSARHDVVAIGEALTPVLRTALADPSQRGTALRMLLILDDGQRLPLFSELIQLASVGHSDIGLVRDVIRSLPGYWVETNLRSEIWPTLDHGGDEEYRRLAELLRDLDSELLQELVARAAQSEDEDIREVAEDFAAW